MEVVIVGALVAVLAWGLYRNTQAGICQKCRKRVRKEAAVCPYCGNEFGA